MNFKRGIKTLRQWNWELIIWTGGMVWLAFFVNPDHITWSLCPLKNLGFEHCPGCGLGRSVSYLLHGEFEESFQVHPLGGFALIMLTYRIIQLARLEITEINKRIGLKKSI